MTVVRKGRSAQRSARPVVVGRWVWEPAKRAAASNSAAVRSSVRRVGRLAAARSMPALRPAARRWRDFSHLAGLELLDERARLEAETAALDRPPAGPNKRIQAMWGAAFARTAGAPARASRETATSRLWNRVIEGLR
jgi:hypothetical protein